MSFLILGPKPISNRIKIFVYRDLGKYVLWKKSNKALIWLGYFHPFLALIYKLSLWKQFLSIYVKQDRSYFDPKLAELKQLWKLFKYVHCTREIDNLCWNVFSLKIKHVERDFQFKSVRRDFQFMFLIASKITY